MITRTIRSFVVIRLYLDILNPLELKEINSFAASSVLNSINKDIESVVYLCKRIFHMRPSRPNSARVNGHFFIIALPKQKFSDNFLCCLPHFSASWPVIFFKIVAGFHTNPCSFT
jgi:hypothetical protein